MRIPLGIVSIGGLVASTLLTLYVVPAFMYVSAWIWDKMKSIFIKNKTA